MAKDLIGAYVAVERYSKMLSARLKLKKCYLRLRTENSHIADPR